jgi:spore coat polysaccharide biosynthesis predicted glycosyltransferase SpsG
LKKIFIIADINRKIGSGHFQRQCSLIEYLDKKKIKALLFLRSNSKITKISNKKFNCIKSLKKKIILKYAKLIKPELIIIDVFQKDFSKFKYLKNISKTVQVVSDIGLTYSKFANFVIKFGENINKKKMIIKKNNYTEFSGRDFIWFRNEFNKLKIKKISKRYFDILICNGGTDFKNITLKEMYNLEKIKENFNIAIVLTNFYKFKKKIIKFAKESKHHYKILLNTTKISSVMNNSKLALMNGGNIRYELCKTGTPFIAVSFNNNQKKFTTPLSNFGICKNYDFKYLDNFQKFNRLVYRLLNNKKLLVKNSSKMTKLFNHQGRQRLVNILENLK